MAQIGFQPGHDTHHGHLPGNVIVTPLEDVNLTHDAAHHTFGHGAHHDGPSNILDGPSNRPAGPSAWETLRQWTWANSMERFRPPPIEAPVGVNPNPNASSWYTTFSATSPPPGPGTMVQGPGMHFGNRYGLRDLRYRQSYDVMRGDNFVWGGNLYGPAFAGSSLPGQPGITAWEQLYGSF